MKAWSAVVPEKEALRKFQKMNSRFLRDRFGLELNPHVFFPAAGLILLFIVIAIIWHRSLEGVVSQAQTIISQSIGWFLIAAMNGVLIFAVLLLFSRFGKIRLGGPNAEPEFSTVAWLAMLFSAGMGIGLVFWSVAEPIMHLANPPSGAPGSPEAARRSMQLTFFHGEIGRAHV